jgi:hypothetical protein
MRVVEADLLDAELAPSCLDYLARCPVRAAAKLLEGMLEKAPPTLTPALLKALAAQDDWSTARPALDAFVRAQLEPTRPIDVRRLALDFLARHPRPALLRAVLDVVAGEPNLHVNAAVALKAYRDERATEPLSALLASDVPSIVGRSIDALAAIPGPAAKSALLAYVEAHPQDIEAAEKIASAVQPDASPAPRLAERVDAFLAKHPGHPYADGLVRLRDRLGEGAALALSVSGEQRELDAQLTALLPEYPQLDDAAKSALRAAEVPFLRPKTFQGRIDKSMAVVQYCKALDLTLDRSFGQRILAPQLEAKLPALQNVVLALGLDQDRPGMTPLLKMLRVGQAFTADTLPWHKATLVARDVLSGRIVNAHWKCLDGLKGWAVFLLLFSRHLSLEAGGRTSAPVFPFGRATDAEVAQFAARLCALQDMRNPAAHRATILQLEDLRETRNGVMALFSQAHAFLA